VPPLPTAADVACDRTWVREAVEAVTDGVVPIVIVPEGHSINGIVPPAHDRSRLHGLAADTCRPPVPLRADDSRSSSGSLQQTGLHGPGALSDTGLNGSAPQTPSDSRDGLRASPSGGGVLREVFVERGCWFVLLVNFISGFEISGLETIATPLTESFGWGVLENSILFGGIAVVALFSVVATMVAHCCDADGPQQKRVRPRRLIAAGFGSYGLAFAVGLIFCTPEHFTYPYMLLFGTLYVFGIPLSMSPAMALYSCKVPEDRKGEFMGIANFVQGFGRIAGPLLASAAFHVSDGAGHWPLFLCLAFVYATGPCAMVTVWRKLTLDLDDGS